MSWLLTTPRRNAIDDTLPLIAAEIFAGSLAAVSGPPMPGAGPWQLLQMVLNTLSPLTMFWAAQAALAKASSSASPVGANFIRAMIPWPIIGALFAGGSVLKTTTLP